MTGTSRSRDSSLGLPHQKNAAAKQLFLGVCSMFQRLFQYIRMSRRRNHLNPCSFFFLALYSSAMEVRLKCPSLVCFDLQTSFRQGTWCAPTGTPKESIVGSPYHRSNSPSPWWCSCSSRTWPLFTGHCLRSFLAKLRSKSFAKPLSVDHVFDQVLNLLSC